MPAQKNTPSVLAKFKNQLAPAFEEVKGNELKMGAGGGLPAGIEGGIAKLIGLRVAEHAADADPSIRGKPYFIMEGIVLEPVKFAGERVSKIIGLYDSKPGPFQKTQKQRLDDASNELRKLKIDTAAIGYDDWEAVMAATVEEGPIFRFRTWASKPTKQFPDPMVNTEFRGKVEGYDGATVSHDTSVADNTAAGDGEPADQGGSDAGDGGEQVDWVALGEAAQNNGDKAAAAKITEAGTAAGIDVNAIETWTEAAAAVAAALGASGADGGADDGTPAAWTGPKVGEQYMYKAPGAKKPVNCEVVAVFEAKSTCNLKNLADNAVYKAVKYTTDPAAVGGTPV